MRVLVFGDSIAQGFWDTGGGWVNRLRKHYDELEVKEFQDKYPTIFNLGVSGNTTSDVVERIKNETEARLWPGSEVFFIFAIGINDTIFRGEEFDSTPKKYEEQLLKLLKVAQQFNSKILFVGLSYVVEERTQPMKWSSKGKCYSNERIKLFEKTLEDFCKKNNLMHVPIYEKIREEQQTKELIPDGVHPNNDGHELIYRLMLPELNKLLNI